MAAYRHEKFLGAVNANSWPDPLDRDLCRDANHEVRQLRGTVLNPACAAKPKANRTITSQSHEFGAPCRLDNSIIGSAQLAPEHIYRNGG